MEFNRDYMKIMRAGKNWTLMEPKKQNYSGVILGVCILSAAILFLVFCTTSHAYSLDTWADAIRVTEGVNSHYPYGIKSVKAKNALEARRICKRTVSHAFRDFVAKNGNPSDLKGYITFLANRYCPYSVDPIGNINWKHNIMRLL